MVKRQNHGFAILFFDRCQENGEDKQSTLDASGRYFLHPLYDMPLKKFCFTTDRFAAACKHTDFPPIVAIGEGKKNRILRFHIFKDKIYSDGNSFVLRAEFMAEAEPACLKHDIRLKTGLHAFVVNDMIDFKLTVFDKKLFPFQIVNSNGTSAA